MIRGLVPWLLKAFIYLCASASLRFNKTISMKKRLFRLLSAALTAVAAMASVSVQAAPGRYGEAELTETLPEKNIVTEIAFFTEDIVNVRHYVAGTEIDKRDLVVTLRKQDVSVSRTDDGDAVTLSSGAVTVTYDKQTGCVAFFDPSGRQMIAERSAAALTAVKDGPFDSYQVGQTFKLENGERLYGLGQLQNGNWNQRGKTYNYMIEGNTSVWIPYVHSSKGYAIFWDNAAPTTYKDNAAGMSFESAAGYGVDYFYLGGSSGDGQAATRNMRRLTGQVPMIPLWAYGFFQSKERYESADETMGVVKRYRELNVPLDCVVQDWQYWGTNSWWNAMEFRNPKFKNYQQMIDAVHDMDAHLLISVWANFGPQTAPYKYFKEHNQLMKQGDNIMTDTYPSNEGVAIYDAYSEDARNNYWRFFYDGVVSKGVDAYWMDSSEPDHYQGGEAMEETFDFVTGMGCTWRSVRNAFPLVHVGGVYAHHRAETSLSGKRCMILTRSGYAGLQRYGANTWSGDVTASWQTLSNQIAAALSYSVCGNPNWNSDIGAFFNGDLKGPGNDEYNELYARWFQFATFCPMMRSHGAGTDKAIYVWGKKGNTYYDNEERYIHMRYSLLPYIYSTAWTVHNDGCSFMNPMQLAFSDDAATELLKDQYMFGASILVAPVLKYQAANRSVYLPKGHKWFDFWTGEQTDGGQSVTKDVDIQTLPIYVRAGSILPYALPAQTAKTSNWDTLQIRIYPGADAAFTLYEDEGDSYRYEQGQYSTISFAWNDADKRLTIGQRYGSYAKMINKRVFDIVVVDGLNGVGDTLSTAINKRIEYDGNEQTVVIDNTQTQDVEYKVWPEPNDDGTKPYTFKANDWMTGDEGRVKQRNISYDEEANTITMKASGAQNAALQMRTALSGQYYIMNDQHNLCVRAKGVSTLPEDHQLWFLVGQHVGVVTATRTFTLPAADGGEPDVMVVWDTSDLIYKGNIIYLNLSGSFITCFGLTPTSGNNVVVSDINHYTDADLQAITTGINEITTTSGNRSTAIYDLQGRMAGGNLSHGIYIKNGKKFVIK